jgi:hypothetical protein
MTKTSALATPAAYSNTAAAIVDEHRDMTGLLG